MFKKILFSLFFILLIFKPVSAQEIEESAQETEDKIRINFFWAKGCPHCAKEKEFLDTLNQKYDNLEIYSREITGNKHNTQLLVNIGETLDKDTRGVPFTIIGKDNVIIGYQNETTTGKDIEDYVKKLQETQNYEDIITSLGLEYQIEPLPKNIVKQEKISNECQDKQCPAQPHIDNDQINLPILGKIHYKKFSLPVLTFIIALLDGFNPCAMWVLVFLISLLLGMKDRKKMWILGTAFIITSGLVYFLFLSAWLNLFLFLGFISWLRLVIGIFAIAMGIYQLRDFWVNKDGACKVTNQNQKKKIIQKMKQVTNQKKFLLALSGIIVIAVVVNLIELVCSAGLPAIYTNVLTMSHLPNWQYYLYLVFYIIIFMLDDMVIFSIAMLSLKQVGIEGRYARFSHLIGGSLILLIGILMLIKPDLLMFG